MGGCECQLTAWGQITGGGCSGNAEEADVEGTGTCPSSWCRNLLLFGLGGFESESEPSSEVDGCPKHSVLYNFTNPIVILGRKRNVPLMHV